MSESDDTDLLLLIPPDFFVVHTSDSEDSLPSSRKYLERSRVDELVSQVNQLQERVNLIESKDNLASEKSFSDSSRLNQPLDHSASLDSNCNVGRQDLALSFYSMSSSGFRFAGRNNDPASAQYSEPLVPRLNVNSDSSIPPPLRTDSELEFSSVQYCQTLKAPVIQYSINGQPLEMSYSKGPNQSRFMTLDDLGSHTRISQQQQWKDCSFLSEIDEFLESKSRQSLERVDNLLSRNGFNDQSKGPPEEEEANTNLSSEPVLYASNQDFDLEHVDKLLQQMEATHVEIERKLQSREWDAVQQMPVAYSGEAVREKPKSSDESIAEVRGFITETLFKARDTLCPSELLSQSSLSTNAISCNLPEQLPDKEISHNVSKKFEGSDFTKDVQREENRLLENVNRTNIFTGQENSCGDWLYKIQQPLATSEIAFIASDNDKKSNDCMETSKSNELQNEPIQEPNCVSSATEGFGEIADVLNRKNASESSQSVNGHTYSVGKGKSEPFRFQKHNSESEMSTFPGVSLSSTCTFNSRPKQSERSVFTQSHKDFCEAQFTRSAPEVPCQESRPAQNTELLTQPVDSHAKKRVEFTTDRRKPETKENPKDVTNKPSVRPSADEGYFSSTGSGCSTTNLLSLSELWGSQSRIIPGRENMSVDQRLEEERYRRKHCEGLIRNLQSKLLEEQQKLAVAVKVDQAKDKAIHQLHTAWKRLTLHWQELEEQRNLLSINLSEEKEKHQQDLMEVSKKVKRYEVELSKILDLAQGYKEKADMMDRTMRDLENKHSMQLGEVEERLQESQQRLMEAAQDVGDMRREVECAREKLHAVEQKLKEEHSSLVRAQQESKKLKHEIERLEADLAALKDENSNVHLRLKEEKSKSSLLEQQKKNLQAAVDESKKKERSLREELREKGGLLERAKVELRDYYQHQVEQVVREKLQEFQAQLDAAEASLHHEMEEKERAALEAASKQIQSLTDKNQLEVKLLEEKHQEELQLYKLQLTHATQQIGQLQQQLQSYSNRKVEIVEKLHTIMETQWQEALRIISGNSPIVLPFQEQTHLYLPERKEGDEIEATSHQRISESRNSHEDPPNGNAKIALNVPSTKLPENRPAVFSGTTIPVRDVHNRNGNSVLPSHVPQSSTGSSTADELPFGKEGQITYRATHEAQCDKVGSAPENDKNVLQKYIEILLNRAPGDPVGEETPADHNVPYGETPVSDRRNLPKWEKIMMQSGRQLNFSCVTTDTAKESRSNNKPPWK